MQFASSVFQIKADGIEEIASFCYNFTSPYSRSFCLSNDIFIPNSNDTDCAISIDGVTCNNCTICSTDLFLWDCSNTVAASLGTETGNQCTEDGYPLPIFGIISTNFSATPTTMPAAGSTPAATPSPQTTFLPTVPVDPTMPPPSDATTISSDATFLYPTRGAVFLSIVGGAVMLACIFV